MAEGEEEENQTEGNGRLHSIYHGIRKGNTYIDVVEGLASQTKIGFRALRFYRTFILSVKTYVQRVSRSGLVHN